MNVRLGYCSQAITQFDTIAQARALGIGCTARAHKYAPFGGNVPPGHSDRSCWLAADSGGTNTPKGHAGAEMGRNRGWLVSVRATR